ncbi:MAG: T9SS type A sorting domain-containing protein [Bacteroidales bacterium]|nr:T9SS type A sorting domain-containing protein [Bacteroidales bacterium]MDT8431593.1 T9SS type A sorting domain-containing protein [Bacteroidales bacterium]
MPRTITSNKGIAFLFILTFSLNFARMNAQSPGFFLDDWQEKTAVIPAHNLVDQPAATPTVNVTVDPANVINKVPRYIYGNNAVTWDDGLRRNATAMTDLKNLDPHVLRWPGGSLSNSYFWNVPYGQRPDDIPSGVSPWYGMNCPDWQQSLDEYYTVLEATNSTGSISVNYSYARYGTGPDPVANAAHMAAEWVRYDNGRSKFWEIGNENFGNWEQGNEIDVALNQDGQPRFISGQLYGQHCRVFIDSMRAAAAEVGADIKIGVVAYDAENSWDPISQVWNEGMMPEVGDLADFLVVHSYFTPYNENSPVSTILNSHVVPGEIMNVLEADMAVAGKTIIPVAMTEWNIFAVGSMQQVSYVNGMLAALALGEYVQHDYGLSTRWDLVNGWSNGNDHGMFSVGGEPGVDPYNPRAVFFYMYYHQQFFGDKMVEASVTGNSNVIAHASTFTSGETGIILVNKSINTETVKIDINGDHGLQYYWYTLTGGDDNGDFSRKVLINGIEDPNEDGGGPDNYAAIRAKASPAFGGIKVDLPPLAVVYLLTDKPVPLSYVYSKTDTNARVINIYLSEEIAEPADAGGFEVHINGSASASITGIARDPGDPSILHLYLENDLLNSDVITLSYTGTHIVSISDGTPLETFTNEQVDNLLPGDPADFAFQVMERSSEANIQDCQVTFNGETKATDENGLAYFTAIAGQYTVSAAKAHLDPLTDHSVEVLYGTSIIPLYMDSTAYTLTFEVTDSETGNMLPSTLITLGAQTVQTNQQGSAVFTMHAGTRHVSFSKNNFAPREEDYEITSDATFGVALTRTHALVKLRVRNGEQPVTGAQVNLAGEIMTTSAVGTVVFPSVAVNAEKPYTITKENYFELEGSINVASDTTIELQMEKSVANITFRISAESGTIMNAFAVISEDTAWFSADNQTTFYNMQILTGHQYVIGSNNFETASGSVFLESDTTLQVTLVPGTSVKSSRHNGFNIYPNPTSAHVYIEQKAGHIREVAISDITGKRVLHSTFGGMNQVVRIDFGLPPGLYFVKVRNDVTTSSTRLTVL